MLRLSVFYYRNCRILHIPPITEDISTYINSLEIQNDAGCNHACFLNICGIWVPHCHQQIEVSEIPVLDIIELLADYLLGEYWLH